MEAKLGVELPPTLIFDYPTITTISRFISTLVHTNSHPTLDIAELGSLDALSPTMAIASLAPAAVSVKGLVSRQPSCALVERNLGGDDAVSHIALDRWEVNLQAAMVGSNPIRFASQLEVGL